MIHAAASNIHWNYFLALEHDLEVAARYVEFCEPNYKVYSVEFAHLLFAAASEVDVIAKLLCKRLQPNATCGNIDQYRSILTAGLPKMANIQVVCPRYGLTLTPWENWVISPDHPVWWRSYNNVKHERDTYFNEATLQNALNALGALLILTLHHYSYALTAPGEEPLPLKLTTFELKPDSVLLHLHGDFYHKHLSV